MAVSATLSDFDPPAKESRFPRWVQFLLIAVALIESLGGFSSLPVLLAGDPEIPGPGLGGLAVKLHLALRPLIAPAALVLAAVGRPQLALGAMAAVVGLAWLNMAPSFLLHGLDWEGMAVVTTAGFLLFPILAIAAAVLAVRNRNLSLAAILVAVPTFVDVLGVAAFAISVTLYGF
jgi:drug/metabolite transporter superfamily protein YnfA